ncbi:cytochrome P450 [Stereum hirsutum FP-91666 SS1]|uniref:cytochrome P450 n=1 Tax=Stereum hirsutum (strain FP-91666) TaxID=721885 RepID=UPI000440EB9A|nr:cytochrome P450 [Stereum hirsutum FP-91666 SS1]EIM88908.1 cytochrome P450 [Stereum hirsutum FP-91666 SS1]
MANISQPLSLIQDVDFSSFSRPWSTLAIIATIALVARSALKPKRNLPPGPKGLPLVGNLFQLPQFQWLRFTEWKEEFGPIFSLNFAGQPVVVLNSHKVTTDLLDRRSTIYSDRPRFIMASEILTGSIFIAFSSYGDLWRKLRKAAHEGLNVRAAEAYQPLQEKDAAVLVADLLKEPLYWDDHLKRSAASTVLTAVYGMEPIKSKDDPLVVRINDLMHRLVRATLPGAFLVEIFPVMKRLPEFLAPWKKEGLEWHRRDTVMFQEFMDKVRGQMKAGESKPSFAAGLIEKEKHHNLSKKEESWLAGTMFGAGAETTAAALSVFFLAMRLYPDVMRKAQAEIDSVVGRDRLPTFEDRARLPYIRAIVKEVLRWRPVGPLGLPRRAMQDDVYEGYFIPKGTLVIANVWAMNRDPTLFPDFDEFRPERFLDETGTVDVVPADTHNQGHVTFGFGRRICIGLNIANQALFIDVASTLWAASIEPALDDFGNEIVPSRNESVDEGLVVRPVPFKCKIVPRAEDVDAMLEMTEKKLVW